MPGPRKVASTSLPGKEETEHVKRMGMRKVRVICTDPDATDSSSDEQDEELKKGPLQKRVVREILIPAALVSMQEGAEENFYAGSIRDCKLDSTMPHSSSCALPVLSYKRSLSRNSSKRSPKRWRLRQVNSMSTIPQDPLAETGKKACRYIGVRQRRWGKWTAELREPSQGLRMWLGTFDSAKEAAIAYDEAARKLKGAEAITNFGAPSPKSSFPSPDSYKLGQLGNFPSDRWPAADMCVDNDALLLSCADLEAVEDCLLAYSPSSVLECSISSDSALPLCSPSSVLESAFIDDCASALFQASDIGMAGGKGLEECCSSRHMPLRCVDECKVSLDAFRGKMDHSFKHEPLAVEEPFLEVLGELFDCEGSNFAREDGLTRHELVSFGNLSEDEGNLMSFDLDAEALTWINIQP